MESVQNNPTTSPQEPELHLLFAKESFEEPLWKSLGRQLDEFFFPKKLPPLKLESKPEPVKDIWGFYSYWQMGALGAVGYYALLAAAIFVTVWIGRRVVTAAAPEKVTVALVDPGDLPLLKPSPTRSGGGGGGGDRDVLAASKGKLPKFSMQQITPPAAVIRNDHPKLAVDPTIVIPPQVQIAANNMPNFGDPMAHATLPSNGTGSGSGIGEGEGGGDCGGDSQGDAGDILPGPHVSNQSGPGSARRTALGCVPLWRGWGRSGASGLLLENGGAGPAGFADSRF